MKAIWITRFMSSQSHSGPPRNIESVNPQKAVPAIHPTCSLLR